LNQIAKNRQAKIGKKIIDGFGSKRVSKEIIRLAS
jgi:hypothetical protein